jgi:hypothetical protein
MTVAITMLILATTKARACDTSDAQIAFTNYQADKIEQTSQAIDGRSFRRYCDRAAPRRIGL